jgi:hypothetical protein
MKKMLLLSLGLLCLAGTAFAGANAGASAYLSWNPTSNVTDTNAGAMNNLYVRYVAATGQTLSFKGGEIDLIWNPPGDGGGCFDHIGTSYKTSSGTTCTYLNRGNVVPVVTDDSPNHYHVAWASNSAFTGCTAGAGIQVQFETDLCADPRGCFNLTQALILDASNAVDVCAVMGPTATVGGGIGFCATPVEPSTWGKIKALYKR